MIPKKIKDILKRQHYELVGKHSAVQICRWTKNSLRDEGVCYKEKFYGIQSHRCCQMTPSVVWCPNKCIHCWRAIEFTLGDKIIGKADSPKKIIDECIKAQRKLLLGFKRRPNSRGKRVSKANMKKWQEAQEPMQFAISLSGEPTLYEPIGDLIEELQKRGKTSFLVTNGLYPEKLKELEKKNQLPTQFYISVNVSNKNMYQVFHKSTKSDAWKRLMQSLDILKQVKGKTRTVFRMNLVKDLNMNKEHIKDYVKLVKKANPLFVEVKGFMSVGFARQRLGYDKMPTHEEIMSFSKKLAKATDLKILDEHERSCVAVLGKNKKDLKIKDQLLPLLSKL
jgi:tRNA wybutosine-synthesizing protein 1